MVCALLEMIGVISIILLVLTTCSFRPTIELGSNPENARETLLKTIQIGSSGSKAKKIMEENQFACSIIQNGEFLDYKNIDYVYCDRYDRKSFWISRRWQIAIILNDNQVKDIQTATGLLGP